MFIYSQYPKDPLTRVLHKGVGANKFENEKSDVCLFLIPYFYEGSKDLVGETASKGYCNKVTSSFYQFFSRELCLPGIRFDSKIFASLRNYSNEVTIRFVFASK